MRLTTLIAVCLTCCLASVSFAQEGLFAPRLYVNNSVISNYEFEQRVLFFQAVNSPGDVEKQALNSLIADRLRVGAAIALDISLTDQEMKDGMEEFASRAKLTPEAFIQALGEKGIAEETFRDFVEANILWRNVIRTTYGSKVQITETDIDRAMALTSRRGGVRLLLSELIIPAPPEQEADARALAGELSSTIRSEAAFSDAAREFSAASSAQAGGRLDWLELDKLPPAIAMILLKLSPGEVTEPIVIPNAIALFQLRAIEETGMPPTGPVTIDYAEVLVPDTADGAALAARLAANADVCDDLYGLMRDLPADQLQRQTSSAGEIPTDVGLALAKLDENETSFTLRRGNARVLLMLCSRTATPKEGETPTREQVRLMLINQRLASLAESYLQELWAGAIIREP